MQNLEHLSYEIPSFAFNDKQKRTKLEAALSPLSKKKSRSKFHLKIMSIELLTGKNLHIT